MLRPCIKVSQDNVDIAKCGIAYDVWSYQRDSIAQLTGRPFVFDENVRVFDEKPGEQSVLFRMLLDKNSLFVERVI